MKASQQFVCYLDESGSREIKVGRRDAIGLLVAPNESSLLDEMREFVDRFEAESTHEDRDKRKQEVKGSSIRPDRLLEVVQTCKSLGLRMSLYVAAQLPASGVPDDREAAARALAGAGAGTPWEDEADAAGAALLRISGSDRYYCDLVSRLIYEGLPGQILRMERDAQFEVVCDPCLPPPYDQVLRVAANIAAHAILIGEAPERAEHVLVPSNALQVRDGGDEDRFGRQLVDWLLYPLALYHRRDANPGHKKQYEMVWSEMDDSLVAPLDAVNTLEEFTRRFA